MKRVFTDCNHIAHLWASQAQDGARNTGNFYYEGLTIYSYGNHFPIAQIYDKDNNIVFVNSDSYSPTTAKHQYHVMSSITHKESIFVPYPTLNDVTKKSSSSGYSSYPGISENIHRKNLNHFLLNIKNFTFDHKRARIRDYSNAIKSNIQQLKRYVEIFKLNSWLKKDEKILITCDIDAKVFELTGGQKDKDKKELANIKHWKQFEQKQERRRKEAEMKYQEKMNYLLFTKGKKYEENKIYLYFLDLTTFKPLHVNDIDLDNANHVIYTSRSASGPIKRARVLYKLIQAKKDVRGFKIGSHTVISSNGLLKIGCHEIENSEVKRIASLLNW